MGGSWPLQPSESWRQSSPLTAGEAGAAGAAGAASAGRMAGAKPPVSRAGGA